MATVSGPIDWEASRDKEGYRTYKVTYLVVGNADYEEGPAQVLQAVGLPQPGEPWQLFDDLDVWVWCTPEAEIKRYTPKGGEKDRWWAVTQTFTNRPEKTQRCHDSPVENPLNEPPKISGSYAKFTEVATRDRSGRPIINSAFEPLNSPQLEFDQSRPKIRIEQNVASITLAANSPMTMKDTVNDRALWGFARRTVKLSDHTWERKYHGTCNVYYNRTLEFEVNTRTWDKDIMDEGTKVLNGRWGNPAIGDITTGWVTLPISGETPDATNPAHFIKFKDRQGENSKAVLNGFGLPIATKVSGVITGVDNSNPVIVLSAAHGLQNDDNIGIIGVKGIVEVNTDWTITVINSDTFSLNGSTGGPDVYISGGSWFLLGPEGRGPGNIHVEYYRESNFALLGIPTIL